MLILIAILFLLKIQSSASQTNKIISVNEIQDIEEYRQYFSVSVVHFIVPFDVQQLSFVFNSFTTKKTILPLPCKQDLVTVCLKEGSLPVISPENAPFPKTFFNFSSRPAIVYETITSDSGKGYINITSPKPGHWFGLVYQPWINPKFNNIVLQDMHGVCKRSLLSYAIATTPDIDLINLNSEYTFTSSLNTNWSKVIKYENLNTSLASISLEVRVEKQCEPCSELEILIQQGKIPSYSDYLHKIIPKGNNYFKKQLLNLQFNPAIYISIDYSSNITNVSGDITFYISLKSNGFIEQKIKSSNRELEESLYQTPTNLNLIFPLGSSLKYSQYNLIKMSSRQSISYSYVLSPSLKLKIPKMVNLTNWLTVLKFDVSDIDEIGGTLFLGFSLHPRRNLSDEYTIVICVRRLEFELPSYPNKCVYYNEINSAPIVLNSSSLIGTFESIHIPYPEIGSWYISVGVFPVFVVGDQDECDYCKDSLELCKKFCSVDNSCEEKCDLLISKELQCSNCSFNEEAGENILDWRNDLDLQNISIIFSLAASPCIDESCGPHGECRFLVDNSIMFSSCLCHHKHTGWDCSNDGSGQSRIEILIESLLLTLSNLGFISSVGFALVRQYYSEAVVYFFTMVYSILYHACDSGNGIYSYCLIDVKILKFCDFYCGLLAIWVTLIAIANLSPNFKSVCQMMGAILLAFGTTYNMEGVLVFIIPAVTGLMLITVSWGLTCRESHSCFPEKKYLSIYFPLGMILVVFGMICYAFLQTVSNYQYIHSTWHLIMAFCVIILLPNKKVFKI